MSFQKGVYFTKIVKFIVIMLTVLFYNLLKICRGHNKVTLFILNISNLSLLFFLLSSARNLSVLLIFSRKQLLISLLSSKISSFIFHNLLFKSLFFPFSYIFWGYSPFLYFLKVEAEVINFRSHFLLSNTHV